MVEKTTLRQLRGLNDLVADALDAGMTRTEEIHRTIADYPYAALKRIGPVASPVRVVEFVETTITGSVYWTLRLATRVSGALVTRVLERLDTHAS
jgi:hypothetical protein